MLFIVATTLPVASGNPATTSADGPNVMLDVLVRVGSTTVGLAPFVGQGRDREGRLVARIDPDDGWSFDARDDVTVRAPGGVGIHEDPDAPLPTVVGSLV